ncbi:MAG: endonuclease/exonuclease/phosphatase family protein [Planctomycetota bacterium]
MNITWPRRRGAQLLAVGLLLTVLPYLYSRLLSPSRSLLVFSTAEAMAPADAASQLRIVTYNIAHGRGLAASNWEGGSPATRHQRLSDIADQLINLDADIVVLNEVDFDSSWSGHINQAKFLADRSAYPYRVEQRNLDFRVLGWTWRFGNAVLSKYPVSHAQTVDLPGYSTWETLLVGKKRALACNLEFGGQKFQLVAAHLSHRSEAVRVQSARHIIQLARASGGPTVVAGDLNSTPPGLPNSKADSAGQNAIGVFDHSDLLRRSPREFLDGQNQLTFPADQPSQAIDWILAPADWRFSDYRVVQSTLSDHRPVLADIALTATRQDNEP